MQSALNECKKGTVLVVYSLSRLARSTKDTITISERLTKVGADLVSLSEKIDTTTAAGKMVFRMLAVLAEFDRDQISERTKAAMGHKKASGECVGQVPYGYRLAADGVKLERNNAEQEAIALIKELKALNLSLREIARRVADAGHTPRGKAWHPQAISNILKAA